MPITKLFCQRPFVWGAMQTPGQKGMSGRMCQSRGVFGLSLAVTYDFKVSGHEDDDHQCAAVTHACGEVTVTCHLTQYYMPYLIFPALRSLHLDARRRTIQMQREVQNLSVSTSMAVVFLVKLIHSLTTLVILSMKVTSVTHSIVQYLANFASGSARVLTIYTRWQRAQSIFVGAWFMVCPQLQRVIHFVGNHILVLSGAAHPVCAKSIWLQNLSKKRLKGGMNASGTQRYISLDAVKPSLNVLHSIHKVIFASTWVAVRSQQIPSRETT